MRAVSILKTHLTFNSLVTGPPMQYFCSAGTLNVECKVLQDVKQSTLAVATVVPISLQSASLQQKERPAFMCLCTMLLQKNLYGENRKCHSDVFIFFLIKKVLNIFQ